MVYIIFKLWIYPELEVIMNKFKKYEYLSALLFIVLI